MSIVRASSQELRGKWSQRLMVAERGKLLFSSHDYIFQDLDQKPVAGSRVPCPMRYRVEAVHGEDWLKGEIKVIRIQEKLNILTQFPAMVRKLAELIISENWSYRFWCEFQFELKLDGKTRTISGTGTGNYVSSVKKD